MTLLTPPAALSEATFGRPDPSGRDFGPPDAPKEPQSLHFDVILATSSHLFGSYRPIVPQASSRSAKLVDFVVEKRPQMALKLTPVVHVLDCSFLL